jgi:hypothetical protein
MGSRLHRGRSERCRRRRLAHGGRGARGAGDRLAGAPPRDELDRPRSALHDTDAVNGGLETATGRPEQHLRCPHAVERRLCVWRPNRKHLGRGDRVAGANSCRGISDLCPVC